MRMSNWSFVALGKPVVSGTRDRRVVNAAQGLKIIFENKSINGALGNCVAQTFSSGVVAWKGIVETWRFKNR